MLDDAITSLNWLWEPEIDAEIGNQVQALVKGDTDAGVRRQGDRGRRRWAAFVRSQLLLVSIGRSPLLETKLHAPRPRQNAVARPRLSARLDRGTESRLTLISAPAGFGKSTLVTEWLATARAERPARRVALAGPR